MEKVITKLIQDLFLNHINLKTILLFLPLLNYLSQSGTVSEFSYGRANKIRDIICLTISLINSRKIGHDNIKLRFK